eukprot:TRINITY_DN60869_c0_g1_i1.p1 TRINITY_DN60869_c0_g1~~TRINITY_DN60869_c0_g1_i1.p1  ORF type:complete len:622 (+),score=84.94 TRINITY_DN60869_c0_g1_i1:84-1949(+)
MGHACTKRVWSTMDYLELNHFRTSKTVQINDWRLALAYWIMVLGAILYLLWNLSVTRAHYEYAVPVGGTSHWAGTSMASDLYFDSQGACEGSCGQASGYYDALGKMKRWSEGKGGSYGYCNDSSYDFYYSAEWVYGPFRCAWAPAAKTWRKTMNTMFVTTATEATTEKCFTASQGVEDASGCDSLFASSGLPCVQGASYLVGRCCCSSKDYFFNAAVEHLSIEFDHSFTSTWDTDLKSAQASLPRTLIRDSSCVETPENSCDLVEIPSGSTVKIPVQRLLSMLGVNLDNDACEQRGGQSSNYVGSTCPKARLTGMQLDLQLTYYNFDLYQAGSMGDLAPEDTPPVCIVDVAPKITWTSLGNDISENNEPSWAKGAGFVEAAESINMYRYGILVNFKEGSGKIGRFQFAHLVSTLLDSVVLLGLATVVTTYLARFCMGSLSQTYENAINERMSFAREIARFASFAWLGSSVFTCIHKSRNSVVGESELENALKVWLDDEMTEDEMKRYSEAVFDLLDCSHPKVDLDSATDPSRVAPEEAPRRFINIQKLIEAMSDDRVTMKMLKEVLDAKAKSGKGEIASKGSATITVASRTEGHAERANAYHQEDNSDPARPGLGTPQSMD